MAKIVRITSKDETTDESGKHRNSKTIITNINISEYDEMNLKRNASQN